MNIFCTHCMHKRRSRFRTVLGDILDIIIRLIRTFLRRKDDVLFRKAR